MQAIAHRGVQTHVRESALKITLGEKSLATPEKPSLHQQHACLMLYQLSYILTSTYSEEVTVSRQRALRAVVASIKVEGDWGWKWDSPFFSPAMNPYAQPSVAAFCCGKKSCGIPGNKNKERNPYERLKLTFTAFLVTYFKFEGHGTKLFQIVLHLCLYIGSCWQWYSSFIEEGVNKVPFLGTQLDKEMTPRRCVS